MMRNRIPLLTVTENLHSGPIGYAYMGDNRDKPRQLSHFDPTRHFLSSPAI